MSLNTTTALDDSSPLTETSFHAEIADLASLIETLNPQEVHSLHEVFRIFRTTVNKLLRNQPLFAQEHARLDSLLANNSVQWLQEIFNHFEALKVAYESPDSPKKEAVSFGVTVDLRQAVEPTHQFISDEFALADAVLKNAIPDDIIHSWEGGDKPSYKEALMIAALYRYLTLTALTRG